MNFKKIFIFSLISLLITSCFKDEGNYEYGELNEIKVNFEKTTFSILYNEELKLVPEVKYGDEKNDNIPEVTYTWMIGSKVVSLEKEFVYKSGYEVKKEYIQLVVEEVNTKEKYTTMVEVEISSPLTTGLVILSENATGEAGLHMIPSTIERGGGNDTIIYGNEMLNVYKNANEQTLGMNPVSIREHYGYDPYEYMYGEITVITENGKRIEELNGLSLKKETSLYQEFLGEKIPTDFSATEVVHTSWDSYVIDRNTNLMYARRNSNTTAYHTGYFDSEFVFNAPVKYIGIYSAYFPSGDVILALEEDADGKNNIVGIKSEAASPTAANSGMRLEPQVKVGVSLDFKEHFKDIKGEIIASDYFKRDVKEGETKHCFLIKNGSKYILHYINFEGTADDRDYFYILDSKKINLPMSDVIGMVTNKMTDKVYLWTKNSIYVISTDDTTKPAKLIYTTSGRELVTVAEQTDIPYFGEISIDAQLVLAFSDGSIEIHELLRPDFDKLAENPVVKFKENYGKVKQIIYKLGDSYYYYDYNN